MTKIAGRALLTIAILGLTAWAALALYLGPLQSTAWATAVAAAGLMAAVSVLLRDTPTLIVGDGLVSVVHGTGAETAIRHVAHRV